MTRDYYTLVITAPDTRHDTVHTRPVDYGTQGKTTWTTSDPTVALREAERLAEHHHRDVQIRRHHGGTILVNVVSPR